MNGRLTTFCCGWCANPLDRAGSGQPNAVQVLATEAGPPTSTDVALVRGAYLVTEATGAVVLVPRSVARLLTGLGMALGTNWRLFRHYWVLANSL